MAAHDGRHITRASPFGGLASKITQSKLALRHALAPLLWRLALSSK
jgi:hypothetical protein